MTHYMLSRNYELMRELLEQGPLLGWCDNIHDFAPDIARDPVKIWKRGEDDYAVQCRGVTYFEVWSSMPVGPGRKGFRGFTALCEKNNLEFILPNANKQRPKCRFCKGRARLAEVEGKHA